MLQASDIKTNNNNNTTKEKLVIFDTTLRDGEQSPGVALTVNEKVEIAKQLSRLGVDVCEAGFPIASDGDFKSVNTIATMVGSLTDGGRSKPMVICALARAVERDIKRAFDAIEPAPLKRIHTFLATSDIHLEYKLKITRQECIERATSAVRLIKSLGIDDIEFSPEDAARSDREFMVQVLNSVVEAGATTLNIPDTVGYNTPEEYGELIKYLVDNVVSPPGKQIIFSTHCHNDLGLATANTLSGVRNGARQVEVTINGIGERAGNTSLEEVVMTLYTHPTKFPVYHDIDTRQIFNTSQLVTKRTGMIIQPNKAIVGSNAFAHESGIHQDGYLKNKSTYEIIQPEAIGIPSKALVLGKHSGRNAFKSRIESISRDTIYAHHLSTTPTLYEDLFVAFKTLADTKKSSITDLDLFALLDDACKTSMMSSETGGFGEVYKLHSLQVTCSNTTGDSATSTATVGIMDRSKSTMEDGGVLLKDAAVANGSCEAVFQCINRLVDGECPLATYEVKAVTQGADSLAQVIVHLYQPVTSTTSTTRTTTTANSNHDDDQDDRKNDGIPMTTTTPIEINNKSTLNNVIFCNSVEDKLPDDDHETPHQLVQGQGCDFDVVVASAKAYINAINRKINNERFMSKYYQTGNV